MKPRLLLAATAAGALALTGCSDSASGGGGGDGEAFVPESVDLVVHTGPGGGSDVFARGVEQLLTESGLSEGSWTVRNESGGSGASAMAFMRGLGGESETIAFTTPTWLTTPLTNAEAEVTMADMTPIAQLVGEPMVMAVADDSPHQSLQDFVDAAEAEPGGLVQTGGSSTSVDAVAGAVIQEATGTDWEYLSFEGGGERIAAVLSGDADMMFGAPSDFSEQVRAGEMRVIATIGPEPTDLFPDAEALPDAGFDVEVPSQLRGVVGPPDMPQEAVDYYAGLFEELSQTPEWEAYVEENGLTSEYAGPDEWQAAISEQEELLRTTLDRLGLLAAR